MEVDKKNGEQEGREREEGNIKKSSFFFLLIMDGDDGSVHGFGAGFDVGGDAQATTGSS
jgi:hypothetical protein